MAKKDDTERSEHTAVTPLATPSCSPTEIAAKALLRQWVKKYAGSCKPGGWEYDKEAAELCAASADLLGMGNPWD